MNKRTLKRLQYIGIGSSIVGYSSLTASIIFSDTLTNFLKGFLHWVSFVMIFAWIIYMVWSAFNKRNPYKIIK